MIVRPKGSVIIPRHPLAVGGLLGWAREINKTVQQLRDRVFDVPPSAGSLKSKIGRLVLIPATTSTNDPGFSVTSGYVNTQIPTLDATSIGADPSPIHVITGPTAVWIKIVGTFGDPLTLGDPDTYVITIVTSADTSTPPSDIEITPTGFIFCKILGSLDVVDGSSVITELIYQGGDIQCDSFGNVVHWWQVTAIIP